MEKDVIDLTIGELAEIGRFANAAAALVTTKQGAISALPDIEEIKTLME